MRGRSKRSRHLGGPVALLVLLPAAAGARIIAAHPRTGARRGTGGGGALHLSIGAGTSFDRLPLPLRHLPLQALGLLRLDARLNAHQLGDEVVIDRREHAEEALVAFLLVLLLRILLTVTAQADALAEVVHRQKVVLPQLVDRRQVPVLAEPVEVVAELLLPLVVDLLHDLED